VHLLNAESCAAAPHPPAEQEGERMEGSWLEIGGLGQYLATAKMLMMHAWSRKAMRTVVPAEREADSEVLFQVLQSQALEE